MHISTKTEYAVRGLAELAMHDSKNPISIVEICAKQNLPQKYMEQLFRKLKKAGLIKSIHGAKGGYLMNQDLNTISLGDIMKAVDENLAQKYCEEDSPHREFCIGKPCGFHTLWNEIEEHLHEYFDSIKLDEILKKIIKKQYLEI